MNKEWTRNTTLREIVAGCPPARPVLDKLRLDYCCGGAQTLESAASEAGVDAGKVLEELRRAAASGGAPAGGSADWSRATLSDLVAHILEKHHAYMREILPRIGLALPKVLKAHGARHGAVIDPLHREFEGLCLELEAHLEKEERVLFPYIEALGAAAAGRAGMAPHHCGTVRNPIRQMEHEHTEAGQALAEMRRLTSDYALPADACPTFAGLYQDLQAMEADLHEHIHLENNILFPRAVAVEAELAGV